MPNNYPIAVDNHEVRELLNSLKQFDDDIREDRSWLIRDGLKRIADEVRDDARRNIPIGRSRYDTHPGKAWNAVTSGASRSGAYLVKPTGKVPYYGWLDFGGTLKPVGKRRNIQKRPVYKIGRYIYPAIYARQKEMVEKLTAVVDEVWDRVAPNG